MSDMTMQAARVHAYGGSDQIKVETAPRPEPKEGEVLVRIKAFGINQIDWKVREGYFQAFMPVQFPWIPGEEGAGVVQELGPGVTNLRVGQAVYGLLPHSYAEYAVAPAAELYPKPDHLSFEQAASVAHGALTAWQAVVEDADLQPGQRVLIHGGAGGVGLYAVQFAKWKGAHVTATTSTPNVEFVRSLGADEVIDYTRTRFEDVVRDVDVVIDTVGGDLIQRSMKVIRPDGKFITVAGMIDPNDGEPHKVKASFSQRAHPTKLKHPSAMLESLDLKPQVGKVFPLSEVNQAMDESQKGHGRGRIIIQVP